MTGPISVFEKIAVREHLGFLHELAWRLQKVARNRLAICAELICLVDLSGGFFYGFQ